jgi:hypothetical protein
MDNTTFSPTYYGAEVADAFSLQRIEQLERQNTFNLQRIEQLEAKLKEQSGESEAWMQALIEAHDTAMHNTFAARIPECGIFGEIAQNLSYVLQEIKATNRPRDEQVESLKAKLKVRWFECGKLIALPLVE